MCHNRKILRLVIVSCHREIGLDGRMGAGYCRSRKSAEVICREEKDLICLVIHKSFDRIRLHKGE